MRVKFVGTRALFLSHGHADHRGALASFLGARMLLGNRRLKIFLPAELEGSFRELLNIISGLQRNEVNAVLIPMEAGTEIGLENGHAQV